MSDSDTISTYYVLGMTCGHCVGAVTDELSALPGVSHVGVALEAGGTSTVRVTSSTPLSEAKVAAALDEAGDYRLAATSRETTP
jgi:copper chaperone CopZ